MKKIDVYIENNDVLFETYNKKYVSKSLIEYILNKILFLKKNEKVSLILHVTEETKGCSFVVRKGLEDAYKKNEQKSRIINIKQIVLMFIGFILLFLSTLVDETSVINEIIVIIGWVPIWEAVELELLTETNDRKQQKLLKKILDSEIKEVIE